jgi:hypothetical protein
MESAGRKVFQARSIYQRRTLISFTVVNHATGIPAMSHVPFCLRNLQHREITDGHLSFCDLAQYLRIIGYFCRRALRPPHDRRKLCRGGNGGVCHEPLQPALHRRR